MATNILQQVITYNESGLAFLMNSFAFIREANKKFLHFNDDIVHNLGDTVSMALPPRLNSTPSLVITFQPAVQRIQQLTVDKARSVAIAFTAQQFIFNVRDYMEQFGKAAIIELGSAMEADIARVAETNTYRFWGDGFTPISTALSLSSMLASFRNTGGGRNNTKAFLPDMIFPAIINSNANQFTPSRNDKATNSWELGSFAGCEWFSSNLLPTHMAGTEGNAGSVLTVVSTTQDANGGISTITFSGTVAINDANSIKAYDKFQISDGVAGQTNIRFLTSTGGQVSQQPVQFRATADAMSQTGNLVTVSIYPPLQNSAGNGRNISGSIVAGMQATVLPDHRCGLLVSGDPLFVAMPRLPDEHPYETSVQFDRDSGASIRMYYGSLFGQNQRGIVHDCIWGRTLVDEYAMMVALPI